MFVSKYSLDNPPPSDMKPQVHRAWSAYRFVTPLPRRNTFDGQSAESCSKAAGEVYSGIGSMAVHAKHTHSLISQWNISRLAANEKVIRNLNNV